MKFLAKAPTLVDRVIDLAGIENFSNRYENLTLSPILTLIPAFKESETIKSVVQSIPPFICGVPTSKLVVIDGEDDETEDEALKGGALVCRIPFQRGQGAALRVGYKIAKDYGASIIVTVDGDGQCDPREIERVVEPILNSQFDLVIGSRKRGETHGNDSVRNLGVTFYSKIITVLSGQLITDCANPLRSMTVEFANSVNLMENQYQASEVILEALLNNWKVCERATTMLERRGGSTKKGKNLSYGYRYGKVLLRTWLRNTW